MREYDKKLDDKQRDLILALMGSVEYATGNVSAILPFTNGTPEHLVREFCMFHADDVIRGARKLVPNSGKSAMDIFTRFIVSSGKKPKQDPTPDPHTAEGWNAKDFDKGLKADLVDLAHGKDLTAADGQVSQEAQPEPPATPEAKVEPVVVVSAKDLDLKSMTPVSVATPRRGRPPKTVEVGPMTIRQRKQALAAARDAARKKEAAPVAKNEGKMDSKETLKGDALLAAVREDAKNAEAKAAEVLQKQQDDNFEKLLKDSEAKAEVLKKQQDDKHEKLLKEAGPVADRTKIVDCEKDLGLHIPTADDWIPDPPPARPDDKERILPLGTQGVDVFIKNMNDLLKPRRPASLIDYRPLLAAVMDRIGSGEMQILNLRIDETVGSISIDYRRVPA